MGSEPIGISSSRAATILGLNEFSTQVEVWQQIMEEQYPGFNSLQGYNLPTPPDNSSIKWGTAFEDSIIKIAEKKIESSIIDRERLYIIEKYLSCHIDGKYAIYNIKEDMILHEGKTSSYWNWKDTYGEPGTNKVPAYIQCQVQHQLLCTGAEKCIVSVLVFPKRPDGWEAEGWEICCYENNYEIRKISENGHIITRRKPIHWAILLSEIGYFYQYPILADKELHREMVANYKKWWKKYIIKKQEPTPENTDDMKRLFPEPIGTIVADDDIMMKMAEYKLIGKETSKVGRLGKRRESLKVEILNWMRKQDFHIDDDTRDKTIVLDQTGKKLVSWNGKIFR